MKNKAWVYVVIFLSSSLTLVFGTFLPLVIPMMLCVVNAGYGGGFSTLPTLIQSHFGMSNISTLHGLTLSAWAFAGLSGNQLSNFIINIMGLSYNALFVILFVFYSIGLFYSIKIKQKFVDLE